MVVMLAAAAGIGLLARSPGGLAAGRMGQRWLGPPGLLLLWVLLTGIGQAPSGSLVTFAGLILGIGCLPLVAARPALDRVPVIAVLGGVVSAAYSLAQYVGLDFAGAPGEAGSRPFSTMGNPDFLAAYLIAVLPVGVAWWLSRPSPVRLACCFILAAGLLLAQSRGAWIGISMAAVTGGLLIRRRVTCEQLQKGGGAAAGLVLLAAVYFGFSAEARARLIQTVSVRHFDATGRFFMWRASMEMISDRPLTGGGLGSFGVRYPAAHARVATGWPGVPWFWTENSHNDYLQLAADLGVVGLGLMLWLWTMFLRAAWRRWMRGEPLALGVLLGFIAVQADAFFNFPWYLLPVQGWFWYAWAWLAPVHMGSAPGSSGHVRRARMTAVAATGVLLIALVALLGRDCLANRWLKLSGDFVAAARWPEARVCAERSLGRLKYWENPQRAANNAAVSSYSTGDYTAAVEYARRSLRWFPDQPGALNQLGLAYARLGKNAEAREAANRALSLNPRQAESWHLLGNLAYLTGDTHAAIACWEAALRERPELPGVRESLESLKRGGRESHLR